MNRRKFIAGFSKISLIGAAATATTAAVISEKSKPDEPAQGLNRKIAELKKRVDTLEDDQKFFLKTLCLVTAVSTGIDLSVLI